MYDGNRLGKNGRGALCDDLRRMAGEAYLIEAMSHPEKPKSMVFDTLLPYSVGRMTGDTAVGGWSYWEAHHGVEDEHGKVRAQLDTEFLGLGQQEQPTHTTSSPGLNPNSQFSITAGLL